MTMEALHYYVWRRKSGGITPREPGKRSRLPHFKHRSLASAMTEANRLSEQYPESRFLVLAAVAEVGPHDAKGGE